MFDILEFPTIFTPFVPDEYVLPPDPVFIPEPEIGFECGENNSPSYWKIYTSGGSSSSPVQTDYSAYVPAITVCQRNLT